MKIGPTFSDELAAAGLAGLPIVWDTQAGTIDTSDPRLDAKQIAAAAAVLKAHDATAVPDPEPDPTVPRALLAWVVTCSDPFFRVNRI